jgi:hypothetical protein
VCQAVSEPTKGRILCQAVSGCLPPTNLAPGSQSALWAKPHTQALRLARPGVECGKGSDGRRGAAWLLCSLAGSVGGVAGGSAMGTLFFSARPSSRDQGKGGRTSWPLCRLGSVFIRDEFRGIYGT